MWFAIGRRIRSGLRLQVVSQPLVKFIQIISQRLGQYLIFEIIGILVQQTTLTYMENLSSKQIWAILSSDNDTEFLQSNAILCSRPASNVNIMVWSHKPPVTKDLQTTLCLFVFFENAIKGKQHVERDPKLMALFFYVIEVMIAWDY